MPSTTVPEPPPATAVIRGFRRRCGRCGASHVFETYFRLRPRCPTCGYRFVREEGAFTGVMLVNVAVTFTLVFLCLAGYVVWRGVSGGDVPLAPFGAASLVLAVAVPVVFYPFAAAGWAAIDLAMRPLSPAEQDDAAAHRPPR